MMTWKFVGWRGCSRKSVVRLPGEARDLSDSRQVLERALEEDIHHLGKSSEMIVIVQNLCSDGAIKPKARAGGI